MSSGRYKRRPKAPPPTKEELQKALDTFRLEPLSMDARLLVFETLSRVRRRLAQQATRALVQRAPSVELDQFVCETLEYAIHVVAIERPNFRV